MIYPTLHREGRYPVMIKLRLLQSSHKSPPTSRPSERLASPHSSLRPEHKAPESLPVPSLVRGSPSQRGPKPLIEECTLNDCFWTPTSFKAYSLITGLLGKGADDSSQPWSAKLSGRTLTRAAPTMYRKARSPVRKGFPGIILEGALCARISIELLLWT